MEREINRGAARPAVEVGTGSSFLDALAGLAVIILAILGLVGVASQTLAGITAIVIGATMIVIGGTLAVELAEIATETTAAGTRPTEAGGGLTIEFIGGAAGIILGVLILLGLAPTALLSVSVIVFGGTLLMSSGTVSRVNAGLARTFTGTQPMDFLARDALMASSTMQALIGLGAIVLGILALIGIHQLTLVLVAFLAIGTALLFTATALGGRMLGSLRT